MSRARSSRDVAQRGAAGPPEPGPARGAPGAGTRPDRPQGGGRWRRPWVAVLVVGTVGNALYFVVPVHWTSPWYVATGALCTAVMAARLPSLGPERRTWTILTAGQAVTVLGDALFLFGPQATGPPVAAGVLYLGAYALAAVGIVLLLVRPTVTSYPAALTDAAIATVVTVLLLVGPVAAQNGPGIGGVVAALVLPAVDVFVLGLVLHAAGLRPFTPAELLGVAGVAALLLGDVAAPFVDWADLVSGRSLADAGWLASKVLLAAAVLHPAATRATPADGPRAARGRLAVTFAALVAVPLVPIVEAVRTGDGSAWQLAALETVLVALLVARVRFATREAQRRAAQAQEEAAALERARLTREIHDVLAHSLSALVVQIDAVGTVRRRDPLDPVLADQLDRAARLARDGLREARAATTRLHEAGTDVGHALPRLVDVFSAATSIPVDLDVEGARYPLGAEGSLAIHRTVQECLTNVLKHAPEADRVLVHLRYRDDGCELTVRDVATRPSVRRVVPTAATGGVGIGLSGLRQRVDLLRGTLTAGREAQGFRVRLWLPGRDR